MSDTIIVQHSAPEGTEDFSIMFESSPNVGYFEKLLALAARPFRTLAVRGSTVFRVAGPSEAIKELRRSITFDEMLYSSELPPQPTPPDLDDEKACASYREDYHHWHKLTQTRPVILHLRLKRKHWAKLHMQALLYDVEVIQSEIDPEVFTLTGGERNVRNVHGATARSPRCY